MVQEHMLGLFQFEQRFDPFLIHGGAGSGFKASRGAKQRDVLRYDTRVKDSGVIS